MATISIPIGKGSSTLTTKPTLVAQSVSPGSGPNADILAHRQSLCRMYNHQQNDLHHISFLEQCKSEDLIPFGLKMNKTPNVHRAEQTCLSELWEHKKRRQKCSSEIHSLTTITSFKAAIIYSFKVKKLRLKLLPTLSHHNNNLSKWRFA